VTAHAEFNIWFNPEAAQIAFNSRADIVVSPLDLTRNLIFTPDMAEVITRSNPTTPLSQFITQLCDFMIRTTLQYRETAGIPGFLVHDASTLGYLFYPHTLMLRRAHIQIETQGEYTRGQTLLDRRSHLTSNANAWIALEVDRANFFAHLIEDLKFLVNTK
jgi:inosine-uridine nucleoside N-ribohydrolase